ncbi:hypothetical protein [Streptomyces xylophagus]|uniref:hypothetical protein n=1 Tax=Streptomyces xylophagus TaxID=285514 RepID=UPI0005B8EFD5|nr:hypothetical protein [Streptomyces xylophagus]
MSDRGGSGKGDGGEAGDIRRSRLSDYAEMSGAETGEAEAPPAPIPTPDPEPLSSDVAARGRHEFAVLLGEFRRTAVLVPLGPDDAPLVADFGGIRWIYAFSNESALARFAIARGEGGREWPYQRLLGARLLDAAVPAVSVPCGVALDVGTEGEGVLFPPVTGIVPEAAAVDAEVRG